jgi:hypothetical protein
VLDDISDEDSAAIQADGAEQFVEELSRRANKRASLAVLVEARRLADEEHLSVRTALAGDAILGILAQIALCADTHLSRYLFEHIFDCHVVTLSFEQSRTHPHLVLAR